VFLLWVNAWVNIDSQRQDKRLASLNLA
jgi:hypothetical protein